MDNPVTKLEGVIIAVVRLYPEKYDYLVGSL
jgi:hypothetical protein